MLTTDIMAGVYQDGHFSRIIEQVHITRMSVAAGSIRALLSNVHANRAPDSVLKQLHLQHTTFLGTGVDDELSPLPKTPPTWQPRLEQLTVAWCNTTVHNLGLFSNMSRLILEPTHYYTGLRFRASVDVVVLLNDSDDDESHSVAC
jgi:hypothetical protein